jgi:hypothetical protein
MHTFEIKWSARRPVARAFHARYGVDVELIEPGNPFLALQ